MSRPKALVIAQAVAVRLTAVANATGYYGAVGRPLVMGSGTPTEPPAYPDGRVKPYFVLFPSGPGTSPDPSAGGCDTGAVVRFSITAAGADTDDVLALIDRIEARVLGWTPVVTGYACGRVRHPLGYVPTPILPDRDVKPVRMFTAVPFEVAATT